MILPNFSALSMRPCVLIVSWKGKFVPSGTGGWPMRPAATWMFCSRMALTTSSTVIPRYASLFGSSQIRML